MATATLTSKGQITLPKIVRDELGLSAGNTVDFVRTDGGFKLVVVSTDLRSLKGIFSGRVKQPLSVQEMDNAIKQSASTRLARNKP
jgi:antitoxin PrlF